MNKILLLIFSSFFIYACGPNAGNANDTTADKPIATSIKYLPLDSATLEQSKIAYGALRFGMNEEEFYNLPVKEREEFRYINTYKYSFSYLFNKTNRLYYLVIHGTSQPDNHFYSEVKNQVNVLEKTISAKYGLPEYVNDFPSLTDFQPGEINWMRTWYIGDKVIKLGVSKTYHGSWYYSTCWIYNKPMYDAEEVEGIRSNSTLIENDAANF